MYRFLQDIPCEYEEWVKDKRGHLVRSSKTNTTHFNILVLEELGLDIMHCYTDHKDVSRKRVNFPYLNKELKFLGSGFQSAVYFHNN